MRTFFLRDPENNVLVEVLSSQQLDYLARKISDQNKSGLIEAVVQESNGRFHVFGYYLRGKLRYRGKRAADAARNALPPTI